MIKKPFYGKLSNIYWSLDLLFVDLLGKQKLYFLSKFTRKYRYFVNVVRILTLERKTNLRYTLITVNLYNYIGVFPITRLYNNTNKVKVHYRYSRCDTIRYTYTQQHNSLHQCLIYRIQDYHRYFYKQLLHLEIPIFQNSQFKDSLTTKLMQTHLKQICSLEVLLADLLHRF